MLMHVRAAIANAAGQKLRLGAKYALNASAIAAIEPIFPKTKAKPEAKENELPRYMREYA
jgi:hypothetical protein